MSDYIDIATRTYHVWEKDPRCHKCGLGTILWQETRRIACTVWRKSVESFQLSLLVSGAAFLVSLLTYCGNQKQIDRAESRWKEAHELSERFIFSGSLHRGEGNLALRLRSMDPNMALAGGRLYLLKSAHYPSSFPAYGPEMEMDIREFVEGYGDLLNIAAQTAFLEAEEDRKKNLNGQGDTGEATGVTQWFEHEAIRSKRHYEFRIPMTAFVKYVARGKLHERSQLYHLQTQLDMNPHEEPHWELKVLGVSIAKNIDDRESIHDVLRQDWKDQVAQLTSHLKRRIADGAGPPKAPEDVLDDK